MDNLNNKITWDDLMDVVRNSGFAGFHFGGGSYNSLNEIMVNMDGDLRVAQIVGGTICGGVAIRRKDNEEITVDRWGWVNLNVDFGDWTQSIEAQLLTVKKWGTDVPL